MRMSLLASCCWLCTASLLVADEPQPVELVLSPRAVEARVLKYRLLPAESELKPGNAVPVLLRIPWDQTPYLVRVFPTLREWSLQPITSPEWEKFPGTMALSDRFYGEMKRAAFRREAIWEYPLGEEPAASILLPDVQGLRTLIGYGLAAKAKYHLSRGELDQAREVIMVGLANYRHVAQGPFLIHQIVAAAMYRTLLERTAELIAQPDSPNLYWALSVLPASLLQHDRAADLDADMLALTIPAVKDLDRPRDAAEWKRMADQLLELLEFNDELLPVEPGEADHRRAVLVTAARAGLPQLLNLSEENVAAMPADEAVVRWLVHVRTANNQRSSVILRLPPREAVPFLKELELELDRAQKEAGLQTRPYLRPGNTYVALWSVNRHIQALRIIEAVRDYLAAHGGRLPELLSDITDLPIPLDPLTDKPFEWMRDGDTATLKAPPIPEDLGDHSAGFIEYRLRVR